MARPATCLTEVNRLLATLTLTPEAAARAAIARSLARRIDAADEGAASGAVLSAVPGLSRQLGEQLTDIVALCASQEDPMLTWLNDDGHEGSPPPDSMVWSEEPDPVSGLRRLVPATGPLWVDTPWPRRVNGVTVHDNLPHPELAANLPDWSPHRIGQEKDEA